MKKIATGLQVRRVRPIHGFTLVELLIVVSIIAILATIATVNFLESHKRAKVSRVRSDMRTLATAIESYRVDENRYPFYLNPHDKGYPNYPRAVAGELNDRRNYLFVPTRLTTPVAYVTGIGVDPFLNKHPDVDEEGEAEPHPFHYGNDEDFTANPSEPEPSDKRYPVRFLHTFVHRGLDVYGSPYGLAPKHVYFHFVDYINDAVTWCLVSHGPDLDLDGIDNINVDQNVSYDGFPCNYDPTNGAVSSGDLYWWGPAIGPD